VVKNPGIHTRLVERPTRNPDFSEIITSKASVPGIVASVEESLIDLAFLRDISAPHSLKGKVVGKDKHLRRGEGVYG
jgi:hypothetical protein